MTTTESFQAGPDFWSSKDEALRHKENTNTNERYPTFFQDIFHAGDEEQFQQYRDAKNGDVCLEFPSLSSNLFETLPVEIWDKYKSVDADATLNTFRYIFHKFKKGIFVKIQNNQLKVFLPFSKANFTNEWHENIQQDSKEILDLLYQISVAEGRKFDSDKVNTNKKEWFGNNCLVRNEKPLSEGDSNVGNVKNMLEELCTRREIPDIEFFINRRDFPIITRDGTEAYHHLWGSEQVPLVSHLYDKYLPILSMSATERYADVMMPTWDDWARIQSLEGKYFPRTVQDYSAKFDIKWSNKKPTAVFRGSTTGCGVDVKTNIRLKLAKLSVDSQNESTIPYLDARITKWNIRPRKLENETKLRTIDIESLKRQGIDVYKTDPSGNYSIDTSKTYYRYDKRSDKFVNDDLRGWFVRDEKGNYTNVGTGGKYISYKLSPKEQSGYKYIVHVDGHVSAFRLSLELSMGCVILLVDSPWKIWYRDLLIDGVHYVSVKSDLSDLIEKIKWCRDNDSECETIANNARIFFNRYLQKDGVMDYMQKTLVNIKQEMGLYLYNFVSPLDALISKEEKDIDMSFPTIPKADDRTIQKGISDLGVVPNIERCYGLLQGLGWAIRKVIHDSNGNFEKIATMKRQIFKNKLGIVTAAEIARFQLAIKTTSNQQKIKEHIHEAFIGSNCLNKLSQHIPNFAYVFGMYRDSDRRTCNVISEFIEGKTFSAYIDDTDNFSFKEFLFIIIQLCLSIEIAQNMFGFVHYDLAPWNVVLRPIPERKEYTYLLSHKRIIKVNTKLIPVMIDFGKSHAIVDGVHHGFVNMFKVSTCQDIITLLVRSLDHIVNKFLSEQKFRDKLKRDGFDMSHILHLANFLSGTKYRPEQFLRLEDLRDFLKYARKYETLIYDDKHELEKRTPYDLVKYIMRMNKTSKEVGTVTEYENLMDKGNGRQVFEYIFSNSVKEKFQSYVNVFSRLVKSRLPQPNNLFFIYYTAQSLERNLTSVKDHMLQFLDDNKHIYTPDKKYEKIYEDTMSFLQRVYKTKINTKKEINVDYKLSDHFKKLEQAVYTEETFLCPRKVLKLLEDETIDDLSEYKHIIETILFDKSFYKLEDNHREHYLINFEKLLLSNSLTMKNNSSNIKTLRFMSQEIYSNDKESLELKLTKEGKICDEAKEYLKLYNLIIFKLK
jgi:hypothetical protein